MVEFRISAPDANWVGIAGDFNGWRPDVLKAKRSRDGIWKIQTMVPSGKYEYKFVVDGKWITDPSCPKKVANSFGTENSVLEIH
ncbi:MAG: hypothetical protein AUK29_03395 [Nitrospirae bacterium CG2_30_53_67]|nr:MAG: hypothetical protein AUK29_03395 [Nitrospirae bacterium CG2_30_53_67]